MGSSALDDFFAKEHGVKPKDTGPKEYDSWLGGAAQSVISGFPELIGANPTPAAEEFRQRNPVSGFITEAVPFVAGGEASILASRSRALSPIVEGALSRIGLGEAQAAARPVLREAIKTGVLEQVPFEVGRALIGSATAPEDNVGDLWASSAMGLALGAPAAGALGWLMKSGGKAAARGGLGELNGVENVWSPTYMLRQAEDAAAEGATPTWAKGTPEENVAHLTQMALDERPVLNPGVRTTRDVYIEGLENADKSANSAMNRLFHPSAKESVEGLDTRTWHEGVPSVNTNLNTGEREGLLLAAGMKDVQDLATTMKYPRVVTVMDEEGAKKLSGMLRADKGMPFAGTDAWIGHDAYNAGVVMKRLERPGMLDPANKGVGRHRIRVGDRFLMGMTDRTDRFAGTSGKFSKRNMDIRSKLQKAWQAGATKDVFGKVDDQLIGGISDASVNDIGKLGKEAWIKREAQSISKKMGMEDGVIGEQAMAIARTAHDIFAPTVAKLNKNSLFSRLYGLAKARDEFKNSIVGQMVNGKLVKMDRFGKPIYDKLQGRHGNMSLGAVLDDLTDEEAHWVQAAANARVGPDNLADVLPEEVITPGIRKAVARLRKIDSDMIKHDLLPTFSQTRAMKDINFDENFTLANQVDGPFSASIYTQGNKPRLLFNVAGKTKPEVEAQVKEIMDEAARSGKKWQTKGAELTVMKNKDEIQDMVTRLTEQLQMGKEGEELQIIRRGLKAFQAKDYAGGLGGPRAARGGMLGKPGTARRAAPSVRYTKQDIMESHSKHVKDLLSFASDYGFRERFAGPMAALQANSPELAEDLGRKLQQFAGIEGKYTKMVNQSLTSVFGSSMGGKAGSTIAQVSNKMMYLWNLGILNPTNAIINVLTPFTLLPSMISRLALLGEATYKNLVFVAPRIDSKGMVTGIHNWLDPMKVTGKSIRDMASPTPELQEIWRRAAEEGALTSGLDTEFLGTQSKYGASLRDVYDKGGVWQAVEHGLTFMSRKSEDFSRGVALNAGYNIGKMMGYEGDDLYRAAINIMELGAYGYKQTQRSRVITGPIGSVMGLFKNFQINYINDMLQYLKMGVKGEGWSPFLWQNASTLSIGGLGASPLLHLADGMAAWHDDSPSSYKWMQDNWANMRDEEGNNAAADSVYFGLGGALNFSLQSSMMMPGTDVAQDMQSFGSIVLWERLKTLGTALGASYDYAVQTGQNPFTNSNVRDQLINATMPRAAIRAMSTVEGEYIKSMKTGYPSMRVGEGKDKITTSDLIMYQMGFTPTKVAGHNLVQRDAWQQTESRRAAVNAYGRALANAWMENDFETMTRLTQQAAWDRVDIGSAWQSARTIRQRDQFGDNFDRYDPRLIQELGGM